MKGNFILETQPARRALYQRHTSIDTRNCIFACYSSQRSSVCNATWELQPHSRRTPFASCPLPSLKIAMGVLRSAVTTSQLPLFRNKCNPTTLALDSAPQCPLRHHRISPQKTNWKHSNGLHSAWLWRSRTHTENRHYTQSRYYLWFAYNPIGQSNGIPKTLVLGHWSQPKLPKLTNLYKFPTI